MIEIAFSAGALVVSLIALVFISDKLIDHSVRFAKILGVSGAVIGLTLLAYGTSMPELAVSSLSALQSHSQLSVSNIIGSNMYNIAIIIGISALLSPLAFKRENFLRDGLFLAASTAILFPLALLGGISMLIGIAMVAFIALYTLLVIKRGKSSTGNAATKEKGSAKKQFAICCLLLLGVLLLGTIVVESSIATARLLGVSEWLIGSTIVAAGTSMPETIVSIVSARKKQFGMSLGNIIGSSHFNVFWVLGFSAALKPLQFSLSGIWVDLLFLSAITALFFFAILKKSVGRIEAIAYLGIYALFILHLLGILGI